MTPLNFARTLAVATLAAAPLSGFAQDTGQLNVICSVQAEWCNMIQTVFARTTGIKVNMSLKGSGEALAVSDQIIVMEAGRIAQAGTPQQLYDHPQTAFVAGFMGEAMLFDGVASADGSVQLGPLVVQADRSVRAGPVKIAVRPEAWQVGAPGSGPLDGTLVKSSYLGSVRELTVATALGEVFVVVAEVGAGAGWAVGSSVGLALRATGVSVVNAG